MCGAGDIRLNDGPAGIRDDARAEYSPSRTGSSVTGEKAPDLERFDERVVRLFAEHAGFRKIVFVDLDTGFLAQRFHELDEEYRGSQICLGFLEGFLGRRVNFENSCNRGGGAVWDIAEVDRVRAVCDTHGLALHMDGARFANALVSLDTTPAEMTWKRGVDMVSFGGTKNGCWCAEAIVLFDQTKADELAFIRKRAAQLFSKSRFIAAQFEAYFKDGLWLDTARHANAMAADLADRMSALRGVTVSGPPAVNAVFATVPAAAIAPLKEWSFFWEWDLTVSLVRWMTSFATTPDDIDRFVAGVGDIVGRYVD